MVAIYITDATNLFFRILEFANNLRFSSPTIEGTHILRVLTVINNGFPNCTEREEHSVSKRTYST
jgi:hypothetical protein